MRIESSDNLEFTITLERGERLLIIQEDDLPIKTSTYEKFLVVSVDE